uniref:Mitochondrial S-adenosylmethionine carrier protein n=1 Tax=Varanus komodoensis TaxID=61221 RepID=A0A8D2Q5H6_VARKO
MDRGDFLISLMAGGLAGTCVDLVLFPLNIVKTRLKSPKGFKKAGGFPGICAGVPSAAVGSFPNAAAFFVTYEYTKAMLHTTISPYLNRITRMLAASCGEIVACLIRVPSEAVKQRAQVCHSSSTFWVLSNTIYEEGILGLYRGFKSTVLRARLALASWQSSGAVEAESGQGTGEGKVGAGQRSGGRSSGKGGEAREAQEEAEGRGQCPVRLIKPGIIPCLRPLAVARAARGLPSLGAGFFFNYLINFLICVCVGGGFWKNQASEE